MAKPIMTPTNFVTTLGSSRGDRAPTPPAQSLKMGTIEEHTQKTKHVANNKTKGWVRDRLHKKWIKDTRSHEKKPHFK